MIEFRKYPLTMGVMCRPAIPAGPDYDTAKQMCETFRAVGMQSTLCPMGLEVIVKSDPDRKVVEAIASKNRVRMYRVEE